MRESELRNKSKKLLLAAIFWNILIFVLGISMLIYGVYSGHKLIQVIENKGLKTIIEEIWEGDQNHGRE